MTTIVSPLGEILMTISGNDETIIANTPSGCLALEDPPIDGMYVKEGAWVLLPIQPDTNMVFNYALHMWEDLRSLDVVKSSKWESIKSERDLLEFGSFTYNDNEYNCDELSQRRIMNASLIGIPQEWTLKDNSTIFLDSEQLSELAKALIEHVSGLHQRSRIARQAIDECTCREDVKIISI